MAHYNRISEIVDALAETGVKKTSFWFLVLSSQTRPMVTDFTTASFSGLSCLLRGVATIFSATS